MKNAQSGDSPPGPSNDLLPQFWHPTLSLPHFFPALGGAIIGAIVTKWDEKQHPGSYNL
ncbi:hypothetical protein GTP41_15335 [Pseudoduganella sp. DS3]|uniref:Uncharacterized protein n=1 Tax=Pseudoduganella guangdongensis TaxID=2692179 RepID=A0A6N9HIQ0_9BURK|nr:hypothetical protein [Pseudoduganella guangdongensis]MYN03468.1 hypothetical protein [Pseudoduganella guangdongensis]